MTLTLIHDSTGSGLPGCGLKSVIRILADVAGSRLEQSGKKKKFLTHLTELADARSWILLKATARPAGEKQGMKFTLVQQKGLGGRELESFLSCGKQIRCLFAPLLAEYSEPGDFSTALSNECGKSAPASKQRCPGLTSAGIGSMAMAFHCLRIADSGETVWGAVILTRGMEDSPFTQDEAQLVCLLLRDAQWLHLTERPSDDKSCATSALPQGELSRRLREVLGLLLEGATRKEIADDLKLSLNTVSGYVKEIYRHFEVHSQSELICLRHE